MAAGNESWQAFDEDPTRELLRQSGPIAISMVSYSLMTLADTLLIGGYGAAALAGVGLGGTMTFVLLCFPLGLLRATKTLIAQALGAKASGHVAYVGASVLLALALGLAVAALGQGLGLLLPKIAATEASGEAARLYLSIRVLGAPFAIAAMALREARWAENDGRWAALSSVIGNGANIALAWIFLGPLHLGVAGAAWATVIAHGIELLALVPSQAKAGFGLGLVRRGHLHSLLKVGLPSAVQFLLEVGSFAILAGLLAAHSEVAMAAHQVALQAIHFSFLPALAVGEAASVLAGNAVGAGRLDVVRGLARSALKIVSVYTVLCTVLFAFGASAIAAAFTDDPALAAVATKLLWIAAAFQILDGANIVARSVLRGAGDVRVPALIGILTAWCCTPPLTWLLAWRAELGAVGAWLGITAEVVVGAGLLWWRLRSAAWHEPARQTRAMVEAEAARGQAVVPA